jgi:hypothetical protein
MSKRIVLLLLAFSTLGGCALTPTDIQESSDFKLCKYYYAAPLNVNYKNPALKKELDRRYGANAGPVCHQLLVADGVQALQLLTMSAAVMTPTPAPVYRTSPAPRPPVQSSVDCRSNVIGNSVYTHCQ